MGKEEVKLQPLDDDMNLYLDGCKDYTRKISNLINKYRIEAGKKPNIQKISSSFILQ